MWTLFQPHSLESSSLIEIGIMSPRLPASPHRLYTNGLLNGRSASVGAGFRHLQSVRLNIRQGTYWFSNTAEIGWKLGSSTSHHDSRVRGTGEQEAQDGQK